MKISSPNTKKKKTLYNRQVKAYKQAVTDSQNRVPLFKDPVALYKKKGEAYEREVETYNQKVTTHKNRVKQFNDLVKRFNANNASVPKLTLDYLEAEIQKEQAELTSLAKKLTDLKKEFEAVKAEVQGDKSKLDALAQNLHTLKKQIEDIQSGLVKPMPTLTNSLKNYSHLLQNLNPVVMKAVQTTAEYASFFRYIKSKHPHMWNRFFTSLANVPIHPIVKTPTHMPRQIPKSD